MADNKCNDNDSKNNTEGVDDSEEENDILEESPCGRWLKRREQVEQRNIPGIDETYLAMDTDEGVEVVWNEVRFSERKYFKTKEETINEVFDRLIQLEHPNIVKLHKYWVHKDIEKPRVIFITEYMSSGSLKTFLRKTKKNLIRMALNAWKRWCTQILSALCYLHSSQPPIVHGNLNCDTIFISYNGLIKIGAVAPDAIHKHVKTVRGDSKATVHFIAPEIGCISDIDGTALSPSVDIYSFGMCALEMAALEISPNGESSHITDDVINTTIESLDNRLQKDFITKCLNKNPKERPTARELLFHPIIFEVPSLKLFCTHVIANTSSFQPEQLTEEAIYRTLCLQNSNDRVLAEVRHNSRPNVTLKQSDSPKVEFEKFFEEVRNGAFPLTAIVTTTRPPLITRQRTMSPEVSGESKNQLNSPDKTYDEETRRILTVTSTLESPSEANTSDKRFVIFLHIIFNDEINRKLSTKLTELTELMPSSLAQELVFYGFVNKDDQNIVFDLFSELKELFISSGNQSVSCQKSQQLSSQPPTQQLNTTQVLPQQSKPVVIPQQITAQTQTPTVQSPQPTKLQSIPLPIPQPIQQPSAQPLQQQSIPQTVQRLIVQPVQQPIAQSIPQPVQQPIAQPTQQQSIPQPIQQQQQSIPQPVQRPIVPPVQQPIAQSIPQQVQQPIAQPTQQQSIPQPLSQQSIQQQQSIPQPVQRPIVPPIQQPITQSIPQQVQQPIAQPIQQQSVPQPIQQQQSIPQPSQQPIAQPIQQQSVPQPIQQQQSIPQPVQQPIAQPIQPIIGQPIQKAVPQSVPQQKPQSTPQPVSQTAPHVISQPTVGSQLTPQQTIRTQIPAQTQTPTQTIPQQIRGPQQVSQQSTQPQMSPSVASQAVGATPQTENKSKVEQRPVV